MALHQFKLLHGTYEELTNVEFQPPAVTPPLVVNKVLKTYVAGDIIDTNHHLSNLYDQPGSPPKFQKIV